MSAIERIVLREKRRWWTPIDALAEKRRWVSALEAPEAKASELGRQSSSQASSFLTGAADLFYSLLTMTPPVQSTKLRLKFSSTVRVHCEANRLTQRPTDEGYCLAVEVHFRLCSVSGLKRRNRFITLT